MDQGVKLLMMNQFDVDHLVQITLRYLIEKQIKNLDEHLEENCDDPNSVWSQICSRYLGTSLKFESRSIKSFWCIDYMGYSSIVNERISNKI
jgi:hypothetical protein